MEQPYFYANQGYNYNRLPRKTITIKLDTTVTSKVYQLHEPITIDQQSDIFIDSFITNNTVVTGANTDIFIKSDDHVIIFALDKKDIIKIEKMFQVSVGFF